MVFLLYLLPLFGVIIPPTSPLYLLLSWGLGIPGVWRNFGILPGLILLWGHTLHFLIIWTWRSWVVSSIIVSVILDDSRLCDTFRIWYIDWGFRRLIFYLVN